MASSHSPTERKAVKSGVLWSNSGLIGLRDEHRMMFMSCVKRKRSAENTIRQETRQSDDQRHQRCSKLREEEKTSWLEASINKNFPNRCSMSAFCWTKYLCQYLFNLNTFITYSLHIIQCFLTSGNLSISPRESMFWLQIEFIWQPSGWGLEFPLHFKVPGTHYRDWFKSPAIDHKAMEAALGYRSPGIYLSSVNYRG